jgi:hypothetical protein
MANISTLTVSLVANTAKFTNGLKRAKRSSRDFAQQAKRAFAGLAAGVALAAGAFFAFTKASLTSADKLSRTASKLGLTTEALAGLRLQAELTGVETRQLDLGIQRMTRRAAEAAKGMGEAQGALRELGIDAKAFNQLSIDKQMEALADAMVDVESQSDRVRLGFKLFDSEGVALINTLAGGSAALREAAAEAKKFGLGLTDIQKNNVEQANDGLARMGASFEGLGRQVAATFGPAFEGVSGLVSDMVASLTAAVPGIAAYTAELFGIERAIDSLTIKDLTADIGISQEKENELRDSIANIVMAIGSIKAAGGADDPANFVLFAELKAQLKETEERTYALIDARRELKSSGEVSTGSKGGDSTRDTSAFDVIDFTVSDRIKELGAEIQANVDQWAAWRGEATSAFDATREPAESLQASIDAIRANPFIDVDLQQRSIAGAMEIFNTQMVGRFKADIADIKANPFIDVELQKTAIAEASEALNAGILEGFRNQIALIQSMKFIDPEAQQSAIDEAIGNMQAGLAAMESATADTATTMSEFQKQAARNMQSSLSQFFFEPFGDGLTSLGKQFADMLRQMAADLAATKLLDFVFGAFGGLVGGSTNSGRALGGAVSAGQSVNVGEGGRPERFTPGAQGQIRPLTPGNFTFHNSFGGGGGDGLTMRTLLPILEQRDRQLTEQIIDQFDRGALG